MQIKMQHSRKVYDSLLLFSFVHSLHLVRCVTMVFVFHGGTFSQCAPLITDLAIVEQIFLVFLLLYRAAFLFGCAIFTRALNKSSRKIYCPAIKFDRKWEK